MLLYESGELPVQEDRAGDFLNRLLSNVASGGDIPDEIPQSYWEKLVEWRKVVCRKFH